MAARILEFRKHLGESRQMLYHVRRLAAVDPHSCSVLMTDLINERLGTRRPQVSEINPRRERLESDSSCPSTLLAD